MRLGRVSMWARFLPAGIVAAIAAWLPTGVSLSVVPVAVFLALLGWGFGRQGGGRKGLWGLGVAVIGLLVAVAAWLWFSVDPHGDQPAVLDLVVRGVASATAGYLVLGVTFFLLRRRAEAR